MRTDYAGSTGRDPSIFVPHQTVALARADRYRQICPGFKSAPSAVSYISTLPQRASSREAVILRRPPYGLRSARLFFMVATMPTKPQSFKPLTQRTASHRKRDADAKRRDTPWRAWYKTPRWKSLREAQLSLQPLCQMCLEDEVVEAATACDHVEPHRGDEALFWHGALQSLCDPCHNGRKQREERASAKPRININDINGLLD